MVLHGLHFLNRQTALWRHLPTARPCRGRGKKAHDVRLFGSVLAAQASNEPNTTAPPAQVKRIRRGRSICGNSGQTTVHLLSLDKGQETSPFVSGTRNKVLASNPLVNKTSFQTEEDGLVSRRILLNASFHYCRKERPCAVRCAKLPRITYNDDDIHSNKAWLCHSAISFPLLRISAENPDWDVASRDAFRSPAWHSMVRSDLCRRGKGSIRNLQGHSHLRSLWQC